MEMFSDVEVHLIDDASNRHIVAVANVTVAGAMKLTGIRIVHSVGGKPRVLLPNRDTNSRGPVDFFYPVAGFAAEFEDAIVKAYLATGLQLRSHRRG